MKSSTFSILNRLGLLFLLLSSPCLASSQTVESDVVVYGGTSAGVSAAIQASRIGKTVVVIEPTNRIGGLTTGGLGQTDIGNKQAIGGIAREFYRNVKKYYQKPESWKYQKSIEYRDGGQTRSDSKEDAMWTFEPSVAIKIFSLRLAQENNITLVYGQRLDRMNGVRKIKGVIASIAMESGQLYKGKMFVDATYEGDLMAAAGVKYTVGREANRQYKESLNGIQANDTSRSIVGIVSVNGKNHNFVPGVDPYVIKGNPMSGLLPFVGSKKMGKNGSKSNGIQAYCFRMCLTDFPENRIPSEKPEGYKETDYELLIRNFAAGQTVIPWINSSMPNRKTDTNNKQGFSTDFIGQNYNYPEAGYPEREMISLRHRNYQKGLMWTLAYHPSIPR